jgi:hypothetical protein
MKYEKVCVLGILCGHLDCWVRRVICWGAEVVGERGVMLLIPITDELGSPTLAPLNSYNLGSYS